MPVRSLREGVEVWLVGELAGFFFIGDTHLLIVIRARYFRHALQVDLVAPAVAVEPSDHPGFERGVGFFAGLVATRAVPALLVVIDRFRNVKLPNLPDKE